MKIIAFTGFARSGKTTAQKYIRRKAINKGKVATLYSFAKPLRAIAQQMYPMMEFYDQSVKEVVHPKVGRTPREVLQLLGTDVARLIYDKTWVDMTEHTIKRHKDDNYFIIDDMRFPNECQILDNLHEEDERFEVHTVAVGRESEMPDMSDELHESEQKILLTMDMCKYDVFNNGTLDDYYASLDILWEHIHG